MPDHLFIVLAGPNGSGKTTCAQRCDLGNLMRGVRFLNPDNETLRRLRAAGYAGFHDASEETQKLLFIESANDVSVQLETAIHHRENVGVETVLSTEKYLPLIDQVRATGGHFLLIYIVVNTPELACERVAIRASLRGHSVPSDKIHDRWYKSIQNLPHFAALAKAFWVFDNSDSNPENPPVLVTHGVDGQQVRRPVPSFPLLDQQLARIPIQRSEDSGS